MHFQKSGQFNKHARFTTIDRLENTKPNKEILGGRLIQRNNFVSLQKLQTRYRTGLHQELNM